MRKEFAAPVLFYRALYDAVNTRPDIISHIRAILLAALDAPGSGPSGPSGPSPWHKVITDGTFRLVPLIHEQHLSTTGLAVNQLAIVSAAPELEHTMRTIAANMTRVPEPKPKTEAEAKPEADTEPKPEPRLPYFTIAPCLKRRHSEAADSEADDAVEAAL